VWSALTRQAGPRFTPLPTQAGLHLALLTPGAPDDEELAARAARRQLRLSRLRRSYQFSEPRAGIVVGFGAIATPDVPRAISMLRDCLE
jgi:GntR family transcriptional regulator/MocR family aminotransferase